MAQNGIEVRILLTGRGKVCKRESVLIRVEIEKEGRKEEEKVL